MGSRVGNPLLWCLFVGSLFHYTYRSQYLAVVEEFQGSTMASGLVVDISAEYDFSRYSVDQSVDINFTS